MSQRKVLIYVPFMDQTWGGVRQYTTTLLRLLAKQNEFAVIVYHNSNDEEILKVLSECPEIKRVSDIDVNISSWKKMKISLRNFLISIGEKISGQSIARVKIDLLQSIIDSQGISIVHCPYQYLPSFRNAKGITTFHDVQELYFPEFFSSKERAYRASSYPKFLKQTSAVFASYKHVKKDILQFFEQPDEKVYIALLQMDNHWVNHMNESNIQDLSNYQLPSSFLLYPANTWKHKNHEFLIRGIADLNQAGKAISVVLTGNNKNEEGDRLKKLSSELGVSHLIHFLGIVDENLLYTLYKTCTAVVVPTLYEAGSFPLMEAILLEIPVICSTTTSLPETIGDSQFTFDPKNSSELQARLNSIFFDSEYRNASKLNASSRRKSIIETGALETFLTCYRNIAK